MSDTVRALLLYLLLPFLTPGLYLSGIEDHLIAMIQNGNHYEKTFLSTHSNHLGRISIEMAVPNNWMKGVRSSPLQIRFSSGCGCMQNLEGEPTNTTMSQRFWQPMTQPLVASLSIFSLPYPLLASWNQSTICRGGSARWADY